MKTRAKIICRFGQLFIRSIFKTSTEANLNITTSFIVFSYVFYSYGMLSTTLTEIRRPVISGKPSLFSRSEIPLAWMEWYSTKYVLKSIGGFNIQCGIEVSSISILLVFPCLWWEWIMKACHHFWKLSAMFLILTVKCILWTNYKRQLQHCDHSVCTTNVKRKYIIILADWDLVAAVLFRTSSLYSKTLSF